MYIYMQHKLTIVSFQRYALFNRIQFNIFIVFTGVLV